MDEDDIKAIDDAILKAWHLGVSNGIDGESEYRGAWARADDARRKFESLREEMRVRLQAIMRKANTR